jgi:hypothetical protein
MPIWGLRSVNDHRGDSDDTQAYGTNSLDRAQGSATIRGQRQAIDVDKYANTWPVTSFVANRVRDDTMPIWGLRSVNDHRGDSEDTQAYGTNSMDRA